MGSSQDDDNASETNCTYFYSADEKKKVLIAVGTSGLLSLSLCVVAIAMVFCYKLHREFAYRLASYQVVGSVLISFTIMLATVPVVNDSHPYHVLCVATGFLLQYFMWVKLLFALSLVFHVFCLAVFFKDLKKLEPCYVTAAFCFPLLFTWIPFIHSSYGLTESWCWIRDTECDNHERYIQGFIEQYALWFGPLGVSIAISFIAIIAILIAFKRRYSQLSMTTESDSLLEDHMKQYLVKVYFRKLIPLLIYPIVYFALFTFPLFRQLKHDLASHENFDLSLVHLVCYASVGLLSGLLLILHVSLVKRLKTWEEYFFPKNLDSTASSFSNGTGKISFTLN